MVYDALLQRPLNALIHIHWEPLHHAQFSTKQQHKIDLVYTYYIFHLYSSLHNGTHAYVISKVSYLLFAIYLLTIPFCKWNSCGCLAPDFDCSQNGRPIWNLHRMTNRLDVSHSNRSASFPSNPGKPIQQLTHPNGLRGFSPARGGQSSPLLQT